MNCRALQGSPASPHQHQSLAPHWQLAPGSEQAVSPRALVSSRLGKQRYLSLRWQPSGGCGWEGLFLADPPTPWNPPASVTTVPIGLSPVQPPGCLQLPVWAAGAGGR